MYLHIYTHKYNQCIYTTQNDIYINIYTCGIQKLKKIKKKGLKKAKRRKKQNKKTQPDVTQEAVDRCK